MNNLNPVASFYQHGLPGMTLRQKDQPARPILRRCQCGKVVSENKTYCFACLNAAIERIAAGEGNQAEIRAAMTQSMPEQRVAMVHRLREKMAQREVSKENTCDSDTPSANAEPASTSR